MLEYLYKTYTIVKLEGLGCNFRNYKSPRWRYERMQLEARINKILGKDNWSPTSPDRTNILLKDDSKVLNLREEFPENFQGFFERPANNYRLAFRDNRLPWEPKHNALLKKMPLSQLPEIEEWLEENGIKAAVSDHWHYGYYCRFVIPSDNDFLFFKMRWDNG